MFNFSAHTTDDRGKRVPLLNIHGVHREQYRQDPALAELIQRIAAATQPSLTDRVSGRNLTILIPGLGMLIGVLFTSQLAPNWPGWLAGLLIVPFGIAAIQLQVMLN